MIVTDADLAAADEAIEQARKRTPDIALTDVERAAEAMRLAEIADRTARIRQAQAAAEAMRQRRAAQDQARAEHATAEQATGKLRASLAAELRKSRHQVAAAVNAAQQALQAAAEASRAHDQLVRRAATQLRDAGLPLEREGVEFTMGGSSPTARRCSVRLDDSVWLGVDAEQVIARAVYAATRATFGEAPRSIATTMRYSIFDIAQLDKRPDGLLTDAPLERPKG